MTFICGRGTRLGRVVAARNLSTEEITNDDLQTLDEALVVLAKLEKIIRRQRDVAVTCLQLRALIPAPVNPAPADTAAPAVAEPS